MGPWVLVNYLFGFWGTFSFCIYHQKCATQPRSGPGSAPIQNSLIENRHLELMQQTRVCVCLLFIYFSFTCQAFVHSGVLRKMEPSSPSTDAGSSPTSSPEAPTTRGGFVPLRMESNYDFNKRAQEDGLYIGISGMIGAGKSTLAAALGKELGLPVY